MEQEKAVLTVVGKNAIGILGKAATTVADARGSIIQVSQIVMDEYFTMTMMIDISGLTCGIHELENKVKTALPNLEVHLVHDNIYTAMHSI